MLKSIATAPQFWLLNVIVRCTSLENTLFSSHAPPPAFVSHECMVRFVRHEPRRRLTLINAKKYCHRTTVLVLECCCSLYIFEKMTLFPQHAFVFNEYVVWLCKKKSMGFERGKRYKNSVF
jgi:hypothetical protein